MSHWRNKKIPGDIGQWKHVDPKPMRCSKSNSKREVYSSTVLSQETKKSQSSCLHLKQLEKEEQTKPKLRRKWIIKIRAERDKTIAKN